MTREVTLVEALEQVQRARALDATANLEVVRVDTTKAAARAGADAEGLMALGRVDEAMALVMAQPPGAIQAAKVAARAATLEKMSGPSYSQATRRLAARALKDLNRNTLEY